MKNSLLTHKHRLNLFILAAMIFGLAPNAMLAQSEYHSYSNINHTYGTSSSLYTGNSDHYPERLFDNDLSTKYCVVFINNTWAGYLSVTFESNDLIIPTGYVIYTGDDTESESGRNPKNWHIDAKVNESDSWTTIHTVTNANLPALNKEKVEYTISGVTTAYKYFRFYITDIVSGSTFQLQDFYFIATVQGGGGGVCTPTWTGSSSYYISKFMVTKGSTTLLENSTSGDARQNNDYYDTKTITASPGDELSCQITCSSSGTYGYAMWVDFDGNGLTSDDMVFGTSSYQYSPYTGTLTIPANTPFGEYRLRILADYNTSVPSDPCGSYQNGESEDYKLNIVKAPASIPYTENFENGQNGWEFGNGTQTNYWMVGNNTSYSSSNSLYITNNGSANDYSHTISYVYAYRMLNIPSAGDYVVSFKWKANGESSYDLLRAFMIPASVNPTLTGGSANGQSSNNNSTPTGWIDVANPSGKLNLQTSWQSSEKNVNLSTAGVYYLVFFWKNDGSGGTTPPAAVDDIDIHADTPSITEIYTVADWEAFCSAVNNGHDYSGETVTLENDITTAVTTMAGTITGETVGNAFKGTFDGQGHTLTLDISGGASSGWSFTAPFRCIDGATIKDLKTTGTVTQTGGKGAAGLVGCSTGTCTITNCVSNVTINSQTNGDGTHGGFVSYIKSNSVTFNGCAFTGSITGSTTNYCGGFVGWNAITANFNNCVFAPTAITFDYTTGNSANFSRNGGTFNNCYYTQTCGTGWTQGKLMHSITGASGITVEMRGTSTDSDYDVSGITAYSGSNGLLYNNTIIAGANDVVNLALSGAEAGTTYTSNYGTLVPSRSDNYVLTLPSDLADDVDVVISTISAHAITYVTNDSDKGTISGPATAGAGATVNVTISAEDGYALGSLSYTYNNGAPIDITSSASFTMPQYNVTVNATFVRECSSSGTADVVTGTGNNSHVPMYTLDADLGFKSEYIIPASYFAEAGILNGDRLTTLTLYRYYGSYNNSGWTAKSLTIILANTNDSNYGSSSPYSYKANGGTTVYGPSDYSSDNISADTPYTFDFSSTPFTYTGGNVAVQISCINGGIYATSNWYGVSNTENNQGIYNSGTSSGSAYNPSSVTTTTIAVEFIPKTTFGYSRSGSTATVSFSPASGTIFTGGSKTVTLTSSESGLEIYYTTDGSEPTTSSSHGTSPVSVTISSDATIKAFAYDDPVNDGCGAGPTATATYQWGKSITYTNDSNGTVTGPESAVEGAVVTVTAHPNYGYELDEVTVTKDSDNSTVTVIGNSFTMPDGDVTVYATFQELNLNDCDKSYGTGTLTTIFAPLGVLYNMSYDQMIYTPEQLGFADGMDYTISKIRFRSSAGSGQPRTIKIYMGLTDKETFSSNIDFIPVSELTQVYGGNSGTSWSISSDWNEFDIDFEYESGYNIVIAMYSTVAEYAYSSFYYTATTGDQVIYAVSDSNDPAPNISDWSSYSGSKSLSKDLPNLQLEACPNLKIWTSVVTSQPAGYSVSVDGNNITISSAEGLAWLSRLVSGLGGTPQNMSGKTITLANDIDMSAYVWVPIGYNSSKAFKGTFDGNYHTISGLSIANATQIDAVETIHEDMQYTGLFGYVEGTTAHQATVKNTIVVGSTLSNAHSSGDIGVLVGHVGNYVNIEMCETAATLNALGDIITMGGVVGQVSSSNSAIKACMSMGVLKDNNKVVSHLGGLVGYSIMNGSNPFSDCFANCIIESGNGETNTGAVVATTNSSKNLYAHPGASGATAVANGGTINNVFAPASGYSSGYNNTFTAVNYTYGQQNNLITGTGSLLVDTLNKNVAEGYKWIRPSTSHINNGYPIVVRSNDADLMAVVGLSGDKKVYFGEANAMIGDARYDVAGADIYIYGGGTLTCKPTYAHLYIDENASIKLSSGVSNVVATVGVTMDNSKADVVTGSLLGRDWHCFATPLKDVPLGISYTPYDPDNDGSEDPVPYGEENSALVHSLMSFDGNGYFPATLDSYKSDVDFYDFSEPAYHWINLKRNPASHYYSDIIIDNEGHHQSITYTGSDNLVSGNGYLLAIGDNTAAKRNVYLSATGTLQDDDVTVTVTNSGAHLAGYNFLGNPYQSYLDFNEFATANEEILWDGDEEGMGYMAYLIYDADEGRFNEYLFIDDEASEPTGQSFSQGAAQNASRYIHPHQAFFVVKKTADPAAPAVHQVTFTSDMCNPRGWQSTFRNEEQPHYPLVNLFCTDENGKKEVSVIEVERPRAAGSLKMKEMLNGKGNMYIRWNDEDFSNVFIEGTPEYVPVWFKSVEEGIFTMSWSTANDNFGYLHLIDNLTGNDIDMLAAESYAFQSKPSDSKARFRLVFKPLGIEEETTSEQGENFAFINGNELVVTGEGELSFIDLNGRILATEYVSGQQSHIAMPKVAVGMYMLRLSNSDGVKVQKIVVRK